MNEELALQELQRRLTALIDELAHKDTLNDIGHQIATLAETAKAARAHGAHDLADDLSRGLTIMAYAQLALSLERVKRGDVKAATLLECCQMFEVPERTDPEHN